MRKLSLSQKLRRREINVDVQEESELSGNRENFCNVPDAFVNEKKKISQETILSGGSIAFLTQDSQGLSKSFGTLSRVVESVVWPAGLPRGRFQNAILLKLVSGFREIASIWDVLLYRLRKAAHSRLTALVFHSRKISTVKIRMRTLFTPRISRTPAFS